MLSLFNNIKRSIGLMQEYSLLSLLHSFHHYKDEITLCYFKRKVKYNGGRSLHIRCFCFLFNFSPEASNGASFSRSVTAVLMEAGGRVPWKVGSPG